MTNELKKMKILQEGNFPTTADEWAEYIPQYFPAQVLFRIKIFMGMKPEEAAEYVIKACVKVPDNKDITT